MSDEIVRSVITKARYKADAKRELCKVLQGNIRIGEIKSRVEEATDCDDLYWLVTWIATLDAELIAWCKEGEAS